MLDPAIKPVRIPGGRSLVIFSCYEYRNVMGVRPYNEIAATIPILVEPKADIPVLPLVAPGLFGSFGYYVFSMRSAGRRSGASPRSSTRSTCARRGPTA
jgi:hypothetical protein